MGKHYTVSIYEKPPKGRFLRYERIDASCKKDLKEKIAAWNKASKDEYIPLKSAFRLG
jgi:hypothetical protein